MQGKKNKQTTKCSNVHCHYYYGLLQAASNHGLSGVLQEGITQNTSSKHVNTRQTLTHCKQSTQLGGDEPHNIKGWSVVPLVYTRPPYMGLQQQGGNIKKGNTSGGGSVTDNSYSGNKSNKKQTIRGQTLTVQGRVLCQKQKTG